MKMVLIYFAMAILILSVAVNPLTGDSVDVRGVGVAGILVCAYLIINAREKKNVSKK